MRAATFVRAGAFVSQFRFLRFLVSGGVNTAVTYVVYLLLLRVIDYRIAYTAAYVAGILLAYALNRVFVFRTHRGLSSMLLFPLVYVMQYLVSLAAVWIWVDWLELAKALAPLMAIVITVPLTYFFSKLIFVRKERSKDDGVSADR